MYKDIFFSEEYQTLFKDTEFGGLPTQFTCAGVDYRFYRRPIEGTKYFDIVSPYGYSGPVATNDKPDWPEFLSSFHEYCLIHNIVAEFARLHPFIENHLELPALACQYEHEIYYIDLTKSEDEIWHNFDKGCKSAVKKGINMGLQVHEGVNLREFGNLYCETMQHNDACNGYFFDDKFWVTLSRMANFMRVHQNGETRGYASLLMYDDYCHYFLSCGTSANIMLWESIKWAKAQGCKIFNLGGGLRQLDSLESFKRSFSRKSKPFYTYRMVHQGEIYQELCKEKGVELGIDGFFPSYRSVK